MLLSHTRNNLEAVDEIMEVLLEKETMSGDELRGDHFRICRESGSCSRPTPVNA